MCELFILFAYLFFKGGGWSWDRWGGIEDLGGGGGGQSTTRIQCMEKNINP